MDDETATALMSIAGALASAANALNQTHDTRLRAVATDFNDASLAIGKLPSIAERLSAKDAPTWEIIVTHNARGVQIGSFDAPGPFERGNEFKIEGQLYLVVEVTNTDPHGLRQRVRVQPCTEKRGEPLESKE